MKKHFFIALLSLLYWVSGIQSGKLYARTTDTLARPDVIAFAPGEIPTTAPNSAAPAFSPDGKTVLLGQSPGNGNISIMVSHFSDNKWSVPEFPAFSGKYRDLEPVFSPAGKYLVFASNRPGASGGKELEGNYNGKKFPGGGGNLWKVKFTKKGWGIPKVLPAVINSDSSVFSPAIAGDGRLYFMRSDSGMAFHIYRAQLRGGQFEQPVPAPFTNSKYGDYDPAVSPDESFIIFSSARPPARPHTADLFIVFKTGKGYSDPIDLRLVLSGNVYGVEARLSPGCKTLYFSNSRNASGSIDPNGSYIWKIDISGLLKAHGIGK